MRGEIVLPDNEKIKYSYELDISSLQKGTERVITLIQKQIDALTNISNKLLKQTSLVYSFLYR